MAKFNGIGISVFVNKHHATNEKAPTHNVVVNFPDGTTLEGGLWDRVAKSGLAYKQGTLKPAQQAGQTPRLTQDHHDDDVPFHPDTPKRPVKVEW
jgi:hypothetical protein